MKLVWIVLLALAASSLHAHPFDDRAELVTSIVMHRTDGGQEALRLEIQFLYEGVYPSFNEVNQYLDQNGDQKISRAEAVARMKTLSSDMMAAVSLTIDGEIASLVPNTNAFHTSNLKNPDDDVNNPDGMPTGDLNLGYYLEFDVKPAAPIVNGHHTVSFFYASTKTVISEPREQLRVFDERGERIVAIMNAQYSKTPERYAKVSFKWKVIDTISVPVKPESKDLNPVAIPEKTGKDKLAESAKERGGKPETPEGRASSLIKKMLHSDPFTWAWFAVLGALFMFGAWHAIQPGHGKTLVASYLIGTQGKPIDAVFLGIVVTVAHTSGVFLLMSGAWLANTYWPGTFENPEKQLAEWIALAVGLTIFGMGFVLVMKRAGGAGHHEHDIFGRHVDEPSHDHGDGVPHTHTHDGQTHSHDHEVDPTKLSRFEILRLGMLGGVIPCPAGFVIGLVAFSLKRYGGGLLAVTVFSLGLGTVLSAIGLMLVHSKDYMQSKQKDSKSGWLKIVGTKLPTFGAMVITMIGLVMFIFAAIRLELLDAASFTV